MGRVGHVVCGVVAMAASLVAQSAAPAPARPGYDVDFIGVPLADPVMQHAKETFVLYGCAYCHGVTLIARGEAADLMHSALVGADVDGSAIVPLLKAGIPQTAKLSPMPQFSDLSDRELHDIARYIHYARQEGRYKELADAALPRGDAAAGTAAFDGRCASCHGRDLDGVGRRYDASGLLAALLKPKALGAAPSFTVEARSDARLAAGRAAHGRLLENATPGEAANLVAYLSAR